MYWKLEIHNNDAWHTVAIIPARDEAQARRRAPELPADIAVRLVPDNRLTATDDALEGRR